MEAIDEDAQLKAQAQIWEMMFAFAESMALRCAVELRVADIIVSHGAPITLSQMASNIQDHTNKASPNVFYLERIMRLLVRKGVFTLNVKPNSGESLYGLTYMSRWLLRGSTSSLAPLVLMETDPLAMDPWHYFSRCVTEGGIAFQKAHGREIWDFASQNSDFNKIFNDGMACTAAITTRAVLTGYEDGFARIGSLVDVGGGTGTAIAEVVKAHPHINGINFDLPHVIATAPMIQGVSHVGGDMFMEIPKADAVFMKWIMHDWGDEECVKILRNCRAAIPEKTGKVLIVDVVLDPEGNGLFDKTGLVFDLVMVAHASGGKERTEPEWKRLLENAGFPRYNITKIAALQSIIEAYPDIL